MRILTYLLAAIVLLLASTADAATAASAASHAHGAGWVSLFSFTIIGVTLGTSNLTISDWAKRLDPDGKIAVIVELLKQRNQILDDMNLIEGNLPVGNQTTVRTGLPLVYWRVANAGVAPSKSSTAQLIEQSGMLEAWSEVDRDVALLNGNLAAFRLSEARPFIEAMNQEVAQTLFYGNQGLAPEEFTGLSVRYSDTTAGNGDNIIKAGGAGADNTSIWLIGWGDETVTGFFPKGTKAGLMHEDKGEQTVYFGTGLGQTRMVAFQEHWQWKLGLAVKDWRYAVRIANVDLSDAAAANAVTIIDAMETASEILPDDLGKPVFYMNRTVARLLRRQARQAVAGGGGLTFDNYEGKRIMMFGDIPIRRVDALLNTEALVA